MNKLKRWKLYDIRYRDNKSGPQELILDLDGFSWSKEIPVGPFNLNTKAYKAVKEVTGLEIDTCKVDTFYIDSNQDSAII